MIRVTRRVAALICLWALGGGIAAAQGSADYPSRPVTLLVPFPPGGATDATMRVISRHFQTLTGQSLVLENKPGAGSLIAINLLANQKPDGYTLGVMTRAQHTAYWREDGKVPVHPLEGLTYISGTHGSIFGMVVRADSPFNSLDDVVRYAKRNPGKVTFGNVGMGGTHNLVALEFARLAGIEVIHVPFKGEADSNTAAMGGHLDISVSSGSFIPQVQGGKMKVLGIALEKPLPEHPSWKTFKEQGFEVVADTQVGIGGPKGMDEAIVQKLDAVFRRMASDPQFEAELMKVYQPVQYIPTAQYRKAQQAQFIKERELMRQYKFPR